MLTSKYLIGCLLFVLPALCGPVVQIREPSVTLPFVRRFNFSGSTIADIDRARAARIGAPQSHGGGNVKRTSSFAVTNTAITYVANVGVGTPPKIYSLLIDTGSSNTWVGADEGKPYVPTKSSALTGDLVSVSYGSGSFAGLEYTDTVTLDPSLVITKQSIGAALVSEGFSGVDGILGLGPVDLTEGTLTGLLAPSTIPTVSDNLFAQRTISTEVVGISYEPTTSTSDANGELTFGGTDPTKYTGTITYTPITTSSPANKYWGVQQSVTYGSAPGTDLLSDSAGIVDTGTTLILLATSAYNEYVSLTNSTLDSTTGLLTISAANYANLQSLFFTIGGTAFELTPNAQIFPRALNTAIGGKAGSIYLIVNNIGSVVAGIDFINGYTFLERFYSVFDTTNKQVGIATTPFTTATTN